MYELLFSSQQPKVEDFRRHYCNMMFPQILRQLTNKIQEEHQQAITGRDNQIQAIQYENVALQAQPTKIFQVHPLLAGPCLQINNDLARVSRLIIKMSLSVQCSIVESFYFNDKNIRTVHVNGKECLVFTRCLQGKWIRGGKR